MIEKSNRNTLARRILNVITMPLPVCVSSIAGSVPLRTPPGLIGVQGKELVGRSGGSHWMHHRVRWFGTSWVRERKCIEGPPGRTAQSEEPHQEHHCKE